MIDLSNPIMLPINLAINLGKTPVLKSVICKYYYSVGILP